MLFLTATGKHDVLFTQLYLLNAGAYAMRTGGTG